MQNCLLSKSEVNSPHTGPNQTVIYVKKLFSVLKAGVSEELGCIAGLGNTIIKFEKKIIPVAFSEK